jgi:cytochrome oxidase Cu insertion factor (SCO1/SenC/PrrC family)
MGRGLQSNNPTIVSAFHTALLHQLLVVFVIGAVLAVALNFIRTVQYRRLRAVGRTTFPTGPRSDYVEPPGRRILRIGFGLLWVFDGLLQVQSSMPLGLPSSVIQPAASTSPSWVQHVVNSGVSIWSLHPVGAAAATVWIQVGLGLWLLVAPRGLWSRAGGLASVGWGLVVWVFGEAFGGIFAPGLTWLFGAPGAVLLYCAGGLLLALPERVYGTPRLGRLVTTLGGVFFIGMALLQAWPGRGFWQGRLLEGTKLGTLPGMVAQMAKTSQPSFLASWVSSFESLDAAHGWAVNLVLVVLMAAIGTALCTGRRRVVGVAVLAAVALCVADWLLVEDLGFLGGTGTDVNNTVPTALLLVAGYVAMVRLPLPIAASDPVEGALGAGGALVAQGATTRRWWEWVSPTYLVGIVAAVGAAAMMLVGVTPMALAAADPNADPIVSQALNGTPNVIDLPAPAFSLTNQRGERVSLSSLRGHTLALTFLDPVCTSDCPLIAQEFRQTDARLGAEGVHVDFVAIVANPIYRSTVFTNAFDRQEGLSHIGNWLYLTGSVAELRQVWSSFGVLVETAGAGAMIAHSDLAFVIDAQGNERAELQSDPGDGSTASTSSFSSLLLDRIDLVLHS